MKIRKATLRDIDSILELCKKLDEHHMPKNKTEDISFMNNLIKSKKNTLEKNLSYGRGVAFLLEDKSIAVGYIFAFTSSSKERIKKNAPGYISDLYIEEKYRGRGFGVKLAKETQKWLKEKGKNNVALDVESWNLEAINLYMKLGFKNKSVRMEKNYDEDSESERRGFERDC